MSHAANLRHRQALNSTPSKRRKLSDNEPNGVNGLLNGLSSKKLHATPTFNIKNSRRKQADESEVAVGRGHEDAEMHDAISISSSSSASDDDDEESDDSASESDAGGDAADVISEREQAPQTNGHSSSSQAEAGVDEAAEEDDRGEPSFGDLLRSRADADAPIDVALSMPDAPLPRALASQRPSTLTLPTATTLATVLTQSLRTNDTDLLESCLQVPNLDSIRSTIERLAPTLASLLLQKLAERMHKRPGRAGSLMVWVQWTVVAHGGYLASQPAAMKQLHTLYNVVKQRATGLQPLLQLKGKLDMLEAQMQLRRNMQARSLQRGDEPGVIYVEAEEDEQDKVQPPSGKHAKNIVVDDSDMEEDEEDEMPQTLANGLSDGEDDDEEEDDSEEDQDLLIDDEAEVDSADDSDGLSDDIDLDEDDDDDDDEAEEEDIAEVPVVRRVKSSR